MGVLIGALTMLGVATLDTFAGATVPVLGTFASLPAPAGGRKVVEVPAPPATPGTCLNWSRPDAADAAVVDCKAPHLFEQAGSVTLADQPKLPDDQQWRQLVNERCNPVVVNYLGGKFDPAGKLRIGALKPAAAKWAEGDRDLRCGVQSASQSGALYPMTGRAADADQAAIHQPGTCLANNGKAVGDPVDCAKPHAVEVVGIVEMSAKFPQKYPSTGEQDAYLQPECAKIAAEYAGGPEAVAAKKLTVYWDNIAKEESWAAGTRKVNCNVAALLPDRSGFAPVSGPVRGAVVVGNTPAPPAPTVPEPGAPAQPTQANPPPPPTANPPAPSATQPTPAPASPTVVPPPVAGDPPATPTAPDPGTVPAPTVNG